MQCSSFKAQRRGTLALATPACHARHLGGHQSLQFAQRSRPQLAQATRKQQQQQPALIAAFREPVSRSFALNGGSRRCSAARRSRRVTVDALAADAGAAGVPVPRKSTVKLVSYVFLWYAFNIVFNLLNKTTLNIFPAPYFLSTLQLAASGLFMCALWATRLQPAPRVTPALAKALLPVALFHTVGHVSACVSFSQMAVSFTHIVKAAEPVFSVALAGPLLGETYPFYVWLSLLPIVAGCSLAAMKEVSFAWGGFNNAMISNLGMVLRNIASKKTLNAFKAVDGINLFGLISIFSLLYCAPLAVVMESSRWPALWDAAVLQAGSTTALVQLLAVGGVFYHLYNQASYMVLDLDVSPVSFSVGNTMKRVAVVVSAVLFFRNPVSSLNWIGSGVAIVGTLLYSLAKQRASDDAKRRAAATAAANAP